MAFSKTVANRLLNIEIASNLFSVISSKPAPNYQKQELFSDKKKNCIYLLPDPLSKDEGDQFTYNVPFLLDEHGNPWDEANAYLCHLLEHTHVNTRPTDNLKRKASRLLDYKVFCEGSDLNWLDFSGRRPVHRPTYKYFFHLSQTLGLKPRVVNLYTSDVYYFYKYISEHWPEHEIDINRVDSVSTVQMTFQHNNGMFKKDILKRSQTKRVPRSNTDSIGYVRDGGELLRPLTLEQWHEVKTIINSDGWSNLERLLVLIAATTGARKQSVLTLRVRHIKKLMMSKVGKNGFYKLFIGPGTGIDTKNGKGQSIEIHPNVVNEINTYIACDDAKKRREKFQTNFKIKYPNLPPIADDDMYVFISEQGNCYYMALDDPRYPSVKSRPTGQVVNNIKRKILKSAKDDFPSDFYYHWLRATFAYVLWLSLQPLIEEGKMDHETAMSIVQYRLCHESRETTENYLKLFKNINIKLDIQETYENFLLGHLLDEEAVSE